MLYYKTVSEKGHIVIPAAVRRRMGIKPGDTLRISPVPGGLRLVPVLVHNHATFSGMNRMRSLHCTSIQPPHALTSYLEVH